MVATRRGFDNEESFRGLAMLPLWEAQRVELDSFACLRPRLTRRLFSSDRVGDPTTGWQPMHSYTANVVTWIDAGIFS